MVSSVRGLMYRVIWSLTRGMSTSGLIALEETIFSVCLVARNFE
jgi:hypothetical protein